MHIHTCVHTCLYIHALNSTCVQRDWACAQTHTKSNTERHTANSSGDGDRCEYGSANMTKTQAATAPGRSKYFQGSLLKFGSYLNLQKIQVDTVGDEKNEENLKRKWWKRGILKVQQQICTFWEKKKLKQNSSFILNCSALSLSLLSYQLIPHSNSILIGFELAKRGGKYFTNTWFIKTLIIRRLSFY